MVFDTSSFRFFMFIFSSSFLICHFIVFRISHLSFLHFISFLICHFSFLILSSFSFVITNLGFHELLGSSELVSHHA